MLARGRADANLRPNVPGRRGRFSYVPGVGVLLALQGNRPAL